MIELNGASSLANQLITRIYQRDSRWFKREWEVEAKKTVEFRHKSWGLNSQSTDLTQQTGGIHLRRSSPTDIRTSTKRNRAGTPKIHLPEVDLQDLCCAMRNFEGSLPQIHRMPTSGRSHPWWTPAPKVFNLPTAFFLDSSRPNHPTLTPILFL